MLKDEQIKAVFDLAGQVEQDGTLALDAICAELHSIANAARKPLLERIAQKQSRIDQLVQEVAAGADAEAVQRERIAELEKEVSDLQGAVSECREACGTPPSEGAPLESEWMAAMGEPLAVPAYVKASISKLEKALFDALSAFAEVYHATTSQTWFTKGKGAAQQHSLMWQQKGAADIKAVLESRQSIQSKEKP
jgi:hypothetical protein